MARRERGNLNRGRSSFMISFGQSGVFTIREGGCLVSVSFLLTNIHEAFQVATSELSKLKTI